MTTSRLKSGALKGSRPPKLISALGLLSIVAATGYLGCCTGSAAHVAALTDRALYIPADFGAGNATAAELGVDLYPGSTQSTRAVRMKTSVDSFVTVKFVTPDSQEKVVDFYKAKLGPSASLGYHVMFDKAQQRDTAPAQRSQGID